MRNALAVIVALTLTVFAAPATAQSDSLTYQNVVMIRGNPVLFMDTLSVEYRRPLFQGRTEQTKNNYVGINVVPSISPAFFRGGVEVEVQPAAAIRLGLTYELVDYFGGFGHLHSFDSPNATHDDATLVEATDAGLNDSAIGSQVTATTVLQGRFGPFAGRNTFNLLYSNLNLPAGDDVYYDPVLDILLPDGGLALTNDADVLYVTKFGLIVGLRYTLTKAFYPGVGFDPNGPTHRVGPLASYLFYRDPGKPLEAATVFMLMNWWLDHRYRAGQEVSQAFPYISVGVSMSGKIF